MTRNSLARASCEPSCCLYASYGADVAAVAIDELFVAYREAPTLEEAERVLRSIELSEHAREAGVGDLYDNLAEVAADEGDFGRAVRAQRRAIELGCELPVLARQMLGWYLLKDGQRRAGEVEFDALRRELGDDPELLIVLGNARSDAGHAAEALEAFDQALAGAKERDDDDAIRSARVERRDCRSRLGLPFDDDDRLARPAPLVAPSADQAAVAVGWFPRDQRAAALERWPELEGDLADGDAYCRSLDARLHELRRTTGRRPLVVPLRVDELTAHAERRGLDPAAGSTRADLAAELARRGKAIAWPPARNEPCWCDSGRKYKRCCAA